MNTPIQNPRSNALVHLLFPADQSEFERRWVAKFGELSTGSAGTGSALKTAAIPATPKIGGDAAKRATAEANFLAEVNRIFDLGGINYSDAYQQASLTEPGATFFKIMNG